MLLCAAAFLTLALQVSAAAQVAIQDTGRTLTLGGVSYFVPASPVSALHDSSSLSVAAKSASHGLVPFSVIPTSESISDGDALQDIVHDWSTKDDVWSKEFLRGVSRVLPGRHFGMLISTLIAGIYLICNGTRAFPTTSSFLAQEKFGIDFVFLSKSYPLGIELAKVLPAGPYFLEPASGNIYQGTKGCMLGASI